MTLSKLPTRKPPFNISIDHSGVVYTGPTARKDAVDVDRNCGSQTR